MKNIFLAQTILSFSFDYSTEILQEIPFVIHMSSKRIHSHGMAIDSMKLDDLPIHRKAAAGLVDSNRADSEPNCDCVQNPSYPHNQKKFKTRLKINMKTWSDIVVEDDNPT